MNILVVEDHPTHLKLAHVVLASQGHDIVEAADAQQALAFISARLPDVILLDLVLPGINGLELVRRLRQSPRTMRLPVVAMTANLEYFTEARAREAGCDAWLPKPLDTRRLVAQVTQAIHRH